MLTTLGRQLVLAPPACAVGSFPVPGNQLVRSQLAQDRVERAVIETKVAVAALLDPEWSHLRPRWVSVPSNDMEAGMTDIEHPLSPFQDEAASDVTDMNLVSAALEGDRAAVTALVQRHHQWIYNLAFRMVMVHEDAEDVTQDVLVKILTKLSSYDPNRGAFRTWMYRIVANHVLNMKTRGLEAHITGFDSYYAFVDQVPDHDPIDSPEAELVAEDLKIGCVMGTLLCLNRKQRLAFIIAIGLGATDALGSEILGTSRAAFRKTLSRARGKLREYMSSNCGLVNPEASCRCRKKATSFLESGAYTTDNLGFLAPNRPKMSDMTASIQERIGDDIEQRIEALHRGHPFYAGKDLVPWLDEIFQQPAGAPAHEAD